MTPGPGLLDWPAQDDVWFQTVSNYWPQSANLLGSIVVCYFSQLNPNVIYYDYQVPDAAQVGGMGWASVANGQLFSIQLPPSVGGGTGFFLSPDWISLISSAEGLSLLLLVSGNGMKSVQFGAASNLTAASGVWSPWTVVAAPYTYGLGAPYPNGSALTVSASINYLPGGGAAAFFSDSSGSLTVMRQQLILAPGAQVTSQWNSSWDVPLPPGSLYGNVGVTEDVSADAQDPAHFHQAAFFSSSDGLELQMLEFQSPAATPVPFTSLTYWPATYSATPAAPSTIDVGSGGAFTALDQLVAITPNRGKIQVFGVTDNTANVYAWTQP
jgi:hypothetical protein